MVKKTTLDKFVRLGGYDIVKKHHGKWHNISEASKRTGIARTTIYEILRLHPDPPKKTLPKYVQEFEDCEGLRRLRALFEKKIGKASWEITYATTLKAWKLLDKKDPISWDEDDFLKIWNEDAFIDKVAGGFAFNRSVALRRLMRAIGRHDLLPKFKGKKRPAGAKKEWYLHDEEIIMLLPHIETCDALLFLETGTFSGGRSSSYIGQRNNGHTGLKPQDINFKDKTLTVFEPKTKQYVKKFPPVCLFDLLKTYIEDHNIKPDEPIFPKEYNFYNAQLRNAGIKAGLPKKVSTHIMKHTFVSQGYKHKLSRETVVDATGTEDRTIKAYYLSTQEKRIRHEQQGVEWDAVPFYEWAQNLHQYFVGRYNEIRGK